MRPIGLRPFGWDFVFSRGTSAQRSHRRSRWGRPHMAEWYVDRIVGRPARATAKRKAIGEATA